MVFMVGFAGPATVGKTTTVNKVYEELQKHQNLKVIVFSFAHKLYETCSNLTGVPAELLEQQGYKDTLWTSETAPIPSLTDWTPRKFLQRVGTECFRQNIGDNFWIEVAEKAVQNYDIALMYDARFDNEYKKCDLMFELHRDTIHYTMDHASAMPPNPEYIDHHITLTLDIDYGIISNIILQEKEYVLGKK